jgi:predicted nuclease of predicted toxin-antitoxin system
VRFLIDAQLPPGLARWLCDQGHVAEHVSDVDLAAATDTTVWSRAVELGAVLVTKDEDFVAISERSSQGTVAWLRFGNTTNRALIAKFEQSLPDLLAALSAGERIVEIR